ncbi:MAG: DNA helicase RecQ [Cyanobacteriota bacterium]|nr:DNA helicase RecQ [Cyanobacteriota bacterium]
MTAAHPLSAHPQALEQSLKYYFGYDTFRPGQREIIEQALQGRDALIIMPTGGGKSLCFQLPALLQPGVTLVVSPLIALMQDQVTALAENGVGATFLNSTLNGKETQERVAAILAGKIKLLYLAPERLLSSHFLEFLETLSQKVGVAFLALDEAHCVSEWGHDFRPEYRQLSQIRRRYPQLPIMALTATATTRVRQDIVQQLNLKNPHLHVSSFNRPNLYYEVVTGAADRFGQLLARVKSAQGSGIIYCLSRKTVDQVTARLQTEGIAALPYHAGMTDKARQENQTRFICDDVQVMVATIAFGMGINKPDVRFVIHYNLPRNLESYYQEAGRAGRDGEKARCTLFLNYGDIRNLEYFIKQKSNLEEQRVAHHQLQQVLEYAEATECRRSVQLSYFGEFLSGNCRRCDNCLADHPLEDWTTEAMKFLSCVARCRERYGMTYIIEVLRGVSNPKIRERGHDQLSTYGIGKDRTGEEWKQLGRSLLRQGFLEQSADGYGILKLNAKSWEVMRREQTVRLVVTKPRQSGEDLKPKAREIEELYEYLRRLRKQLADKQGIPPYMIFADSTLRLMARSRPKTPEEFLKVSGVGQHKLDQYGKEFISAIGAYLEDLPMNR